MSPSRLAFHIERDGQLRTAGDVYRGVRPHHTRSRWATLTVTAAGAVVVNATQAVFVDAGHHIGVRTEDVVVHQPEIGRYPVAQLPEGAKVMLNYP